MCALAFFSLALENAQSILTAAAFFQTVSAEYGKIQDYEATADIKAGRQNMEGKISFKRPDLLRIDFSNPENQVITYSGDTLTIYLPGSDAVLQQVVEKSSAGGANLATPQGLSLMSRYYAVAYEVGPEAVPLNEGSDEMVVKLVLSAAIRARRFALSGWQSCPIQSLSAG